jgi:hypothetical protein
MEAICRVLKANLSNRAAAERFFRLLLNTLQTILKKVDQFLFSGCPLTN